MQASSNGVAGSGEQVVAGETTYHRPDCKILQGKTGLTTLTVEQAAAEGLTACRVCDPPQIAKPEEKPAQSADGAKAETSETTSETSEEPAASS